MHRKALFTLALALVLLSLPHVYASAEDLPVSYEVVYAYRGTVPDGAPEPPAITYHRLAKPVTVEPAPTLKGYTFSGWATPHVELQNGGFVMPARQVKLTGAWTAVGDTPYRVEHSGRRPDKSDTLLKTETLTGLAGTEATANPRYFEGWLFDAQNSAPVDSGIIADDGSLVLRLYYFQSAPDEPLTAPAAEEPMTAPAPVETPDTLDETETAEPKYKRLLVLGALTIILYLLVILEHERKRGRY